MLRAAGLTLTTIALLAGCARQRRSPEDDARCRREHAELKATFDRLPRTFRAPGLPIEELARQVEEARARAEALLASCPPGPERPDVEFMLAHLISVAFDRRVHAGEAAGLELSCRGLELVRSARRAAAAVSPRAEECLLLEGHLLKKRAAHQRDPSARRRDLEAMRRSYLEFLSRRPEFEERAALHLAIADSYADELRFEEERAHLESVRARDPALGRSLTLESRLFDALTGCGDLEAMEDLVHRRLAEYPERLKDPGAGVREREALEQGLELAEFWLGHIRLAQGYAKEARAYLKRHVDRIDRKEAELTAQGGALDSVSRTYRDLRSKDLIGFIDDALGKRPDLDFDFDGLWCTPRRTTLAASRGKVVAALFRNPEAGRSTPFLVWLDAFVRRARRRGLEGVVAGNLTRGTDPGDQVKAMQREMSELGVGLAAGIDPHPDEPRILISMHATWGHPSFVLFDRSGRIAWYLPDPRPVDIGVARRVIERLLAEPAPPQ